MQRLGLRIRSLSRMDVSVVVGTAAAEWDRLTVQAGLQGGSSNPPLFHHEGLHDEPVHDERGASRRYD